MDTSLRKKGGVLGLFRKYQKFLFGILTFFMIFSFIFFGTFSTLGGDSKLSSDKKIGNLLQGSSLSLLEVQRLSRFLQTDQEDLLKGKRSFPNLCNDGVIRFDFLKEGLASLIASEYFDSLKEDFQLKWERAKKFRPYQHPKNPLISSCKVWEQLSPHLYKEFQALQAEKEFGESSLSHLFHLYEYEAQLKPEILRRVLLFQQSQSAATGLDQSVAFQDMALFGFHSASDWFGKNFVDLISQFILNTADLAEAKGYKVTLQEAKGDLIHIYQSSLKKLEALNMEDEMGFHRHLQMLGFDERSASEVWRKVLLFRRYFEDVKESVFVDLLPLKDFASYAKQTALVQTYRFPILASSKDDLAALHVYIRSIAKALKEGLPESLLSLEEIEKKCPELVQRVVKGNLLKVHQDQVALRISLKELRQWEVDHFEALSSRFSLPLEEQKEKRLEILLSSLKKKEMDAWARGQIIQENPEWIQEALSFAPVEEKIWSLKGNEEPSFSEEGWFCQIKDLETIREKHLLCFEEAKPFLKSYIASSDKKEENPFVQVSKAAFRSIQEDSDSSSWIQTGKDAILDQFKLQEREEEIQRSSKENWMKEQAFMMLPDIWSPVHVDENGEVVFFYLKEKKTHPDPILDQIVLAKETLGADAKIYAAERLLKKVKKKNAMVIPLEEEVE